MNDAEPHSALQQLKAQAQTRLRSRPIIRGRAHASLRGAVQIVFFFLLLHVLAGCGNDTGHQNPPPPPPVASPPPPPSPAQIWHGYLFGTLEIGDMARSAEAILTTDGLFRLYVIGDARDWTEPEGSIQIASELEVDGDQATGTGLVMGEACAIPESNRFCSQAASAWINVSRVPGKSMVGEIEVTTDTGQETWQVDMGYFGGRAPGAFYDLPADMASLSGFYREELAEFSNEGDVIVSVDGIGELFFQSPPSGCTANGTIAVHLDGAYRVYDVSLTIESCTGNNAYLNGSFEGLALHVPQMPWDDFDYWLRMWLSSPGDAANSVALTMWASPQ